MRMGWAGWVADEDISVHDGIFEWDPKIRIRG